MPEPATILYDGVCHLCQGSVSFVIRRDPRKIFRFGHLQSATSRGKLRALSSVPFDINSMILLEGDRVYTRSTAALRIARRLAGAWPLLYVFILVPPFLRDAAYEFVARNRYKWFGRSTECLMPTPEINERFID